MDDESIRKYITRVMALKDSGSEKITENDLRAVASELGLSEQDLKAIDEEIDKRMTRAAGFARRQLWEDALSELSEAVALAPLRVEVQRELARVLTEKWLAKHDEADRIRAREAAHFCIEADAEDQLCYDLLKKLEGPSAGSGPLKASLGLAFVLLAAAGAAFMSSLGHPVGGTALNKGTTTATAEATTRFAFGKGIPAPTPTKQAIKVISLPPQRDAALGFNAGVHGEGLNLLDGSQSRIAYGYYTLKARIRNSGPYEYRKIRMKLELLDPSGGPVDRGCDFDALASFQAPIRPGDIHAFSRTIKATPDSARARLTVILSDRSKASASYNPSRPVTVKWKGDKPSYADILVRERVKRISHSRVLNNWNFRCTWEIENRGQGPVKHLVFSLRILDSKGRAADCSKFIVAFSNLPPIEPGEVRLRSSIRSLKSEPGGYELKITEFE